MRELAADEMRWECPDEWLPWPDSNEVEPARGIVGQDRAVEAIAFGLAIRGIGYNVFVTGLSGTGRLTTIKSFLDQLADGQPAPDDVCFVFNFRNPEAPNTLFLGAGAGRRLADGLDEAVGELAENLPKVFSDKAFRERVERAVADLQREERRLIEAFDAEVREAGFSLVQIQAGPVTHPEILPVVGDKPVTLEQLGGLVAQGELSDEQASQLRDRYRTLSGGLQEVFEQVAGLRRQAQERVEECRREVIRPVLTEAVRRVREAVGDERVDAYLGALRDDLEEHLDLFTGGSAEEQGEGDPFLRWRVNLAVDNGDVVGRPVVIETEPTYTNLFGAIERTVTPSGEVTTSFRRIRAGSLLRANGGFLVLNADDLLLEPRVWPGLKRALKYRRVQVQSLENLLFGAAVLKPAPVPLDVKVVVIGDRSVYDLLYRYDADFAKIFKVLADFDAILPATRDNAGEVVSVLAKVVAEEELAPLDRSGMAAMLEETVRLGRWRRRFSSRFSDLADLLREASFHARSAGAERIAREHVLLAAEAHRRRHGLTEDRTHELIEEGVITVETEGVAVGQVNGLAVYDLGHHRFGKPSRITAQVGLGREGVINIERQAGLSGPTHDKGVSILTGFLRGAFARRVPLAMACSITFEQSYGGIDGDSASSTEVYAILSALSRLPVRQEVAVTGSVDQYGRVQAIGGINQKVEGFFRVCAARGLSGTQGVMVPSSNVADLHVSEEVATAVREGRFHVWAVGSIEEGIELLTGVPAGGWEDEGGWSEGSVYGRCQERLEEMSRLMRRAGKDEAGKEAGGEADTGDEGDAGGGVAGRPHRAPR